jgi:hypothetical protein
MNGGHLRTLAINGPNKSPRRRTLSPSRNGKSQVSTSKAINCYYVAYLCLFVRHGAALEWTLMSPETTRDLQRQTLLAHDASGE